MKNTAEVKMKRAVGYIRVSTIMQKEDGYSLQSQAQHIKVFAERNGYELLEIYADEGISGKNIKNRPEVQRLIEDSKNNKFDAVVIWKLTRLGRSMKDVISIAEVLNANNVGLHSISESFDITSSTGRMTLGLLANFSEFERAQISENVKMAMTTLVKTNKRFPGGRMLGYQSSKDNEGKKILVIVPEEAKIIQLIFSKYLDGNGYRSIANALNKMGFKTVKGNNFSTVSVKDILQNPTYVGRLRYNRYEDWEIKRRKGYNPNYVMVDGTHESIIEKEVFEKVQDRMKLESKHPQWNHKGENLLTGLLRCPECGGAMAASNTTNRMKDGTKKRIRYYSCANFRNKGASVCHANSVRADEAEAFILSRLREVIEYPEILKKIVEELNRQIQLQRGPWEKELLHLEKELADTQTKLDKWQSLITTNPELSNDLKERINQLEITRIEQQQRSLELTKILNREGFKIKAGDAINVMGLVDNLLTDSSSKAATKAILRTFIDRITFNKENKSNYKIYMKFDQVVIDQLNAFMNKESTANKNAVGSLFVSSVLNLVI